MGGTPLSPLLAGRDDQFFRTLSHTNPDARDIANHLGQYRGLQRVNVIIELSNSSYTRPWLADFSRYLQATGAEVGLTVEFSRDQQTDFAALARRALADSPAAVVLISSALDTALLATQLRQQAPQLILATPAWAAADALIEMGGRAVGVLLTALQQRLPGEHPKQALLRIRRFQGVQRLIFFDEFGDSDSLLYPMVVRDGRFSSPE